MREAEVMATDASLPFVQLTLDGPVAIVTMDRADKRNAMGEELLASLYQVMQQLSRDESVRAVVVTGAGTVFSSGADRSAVVGMVGEERARAFAPIGTRLSLLMWKVMDEVTAMPKAVIAAVNGAAAGGGMMLALACDFRIVAENSLWWLPEIELGFPLSGKSMNVLRDHFGSSKANEIGMAARRLSAQDLDRMGVTAAITTASDTLAEALALARKIAAFEPSAVATVKRRAHERP